MNNPAGKDPERVATMRARLDDLLRDAAPQGHLGKEEDTLKPSAKAPTLGTNAP